MTEMIERVAMALADVVNDPATKDELHLRAKTGCDPEKWLQDKMARAAIAAMRGNDCGQPQDIDFADMERAAVEKTVAAGLTCNARPLFIFQAMIDAALKEGA